MLRALVASFALLSAGWCAATDPAPTPKPVIRFPEIAPPNPSPTPLPAPLPDPTAATNIPADEIYVIDSDVELFVLCSPADLVTVTLDQGPNVKIRTKFLGGSKLESKTFAGKFIYSIEAKNAGSGELIVWPKVGAMGEKDVTRKLITTLQAPLPPPLPLPKPTPPTPPPAPPKPEPGPTPVSTADVAWIVVIEHMADRTPAQGKLLTDAPFWQGLKAKGIDWKHYADDAPGLAAKHYLEYEDQAGGLPFVLFLDKGGKVVKAFKYPATNAEIAAQLK